MVKKAFKADDLQVAVYETRAEMGQAAGADIAACIRKTLARNGQARIVFAAAPSQSEVLQMLADDRDLDFSKITAFHMDEYVGLASDAPQAFGNFLRDRLFSKRKFKQVCYIGFGDTDSVCTKYAALLDQAPIDIVCMGVGVNGHIAFNDPPVADFNDRLTVKTVALDLICRMQQVQDGCFPALDDVPTHAITLTVPALLKAENIFCTVPGLIKADAVHDMLTKQISTKCPASILRRHPSAKLYLDMDSAAKI